MSIEEAYPAYTAKKNTTVTINYQQHYMTTLKNIDIFSIPKHATFASHGVDFRFPYGSLLSPGGAGTVFEINYSDETVEKFGRLAKGHGQWHKCILNTWQSSNDSNSSEGIEIQTPGCDL